MTNSYLTNIHTRKIITKSVIFIICTCQNMYNENNNNNNNNNMYCYFFVNLEHMINYFFNLS